MTKFDKTMRKYVEKCQTYPKIRQSYPQFETFLPLKSLLCQFYVAKKPFRMLGRKFGAPKTPRATQPPLPQKGSSREGLVSNSAFICGMQVLNKQNVHVCYDE